MNTSLDPLINNFGVIVCPYLAQRVTGISPVFLYSHITIVLRGLGSVRQIQNSVKSSLVFPPPFYFHSQKMIPVIPSNNVINCSKNPSGCRISKQTRGGDHMRPEKNFLMAQQGGCFQRQEDALGSKDR